MSGHTWDNDHGLMVSRCTSCGLEWQRSYTGPGYYVVGRKRGVDQLRSARQPPPPCIETPPPRSTCVTGPRPCRWQNCRHRIEPARSTTWDIPAPTCALDVADAVTAGADPPTQEHIAAWFGVSEQRIEQIQNMAYRKLVDGCTAAGLPVVEQVAPTRNDLDHVLVRLLRRHDGMTLDDVVEQAGRNRFTVRGALRRLRKAGRAMMLAGKPARWVAA